MINLTRTVSRSASTTIRFTINPQKKVQQTGTKSDTRLFRAACVMGLVGVGLQCFSVHQMVCNGSTKKP